MVNKGVHTNQIATVIAPLTYETGVVPSSSSDVVDKEYMDGKQGQVIQVQEDISGQANGSNVNFTLGQTYTSGTLTIKNNGVRIDQDEITETGATTFDLATAPDGRLEAFFLATGTFFTGDANLDRVGIFNDTRPLSVPEVDNALIISSPTGAITLTLPAHLTSAENGLRVRFKNTTSFTVTLARPSSLPSLTINGLSEDYELDSQEESVEFVFSFPNLDFVKISAQITMTANSGPEVVTESDDVVFVTFGTDATEQIPTTPPIVSEGTPFGLTELLEET